MIFSFNYVIFISPMATNQFQASSISSSVYKDTKRLDSLQYTNSKQHYSVIKFSFNCVIFISLMASDQFSAFDIDNYHQLT